MTGPKEYQYWLKDNDKLIVPDALLPSWIATITALEALEEDYKKLFPEYFIGEEDEDGK
jgi:hypothetical protein